MTRRAFPERTDGVFPGRFDTDPLPAQIERLQRHRFDGRINSALDAAATPAGIERPRRHRFDGRSNSALDAEAEPELLRAELKRRGGEGIAPDWEIRAKLRPHLGFDPAMARLHRGGVAAEAARRLRAEAFTIGHDVFFGEGRFDPSSRRGMALLGHELTHVGQQTGAFGTRMSFWTPQGGDSLEQEAQRTAAGILKGFDLPGDGAGADRALSAHHDSSPPRPSLSFAMPAPAPQQGMPEPSQTATEDRGGDKAAAKPGQADARAVADRVYDLMRTEIRLGRERGVGAGGR